MPRPVFTPDQHHRSARTRRAKHLLHHVIEHGPDYAVPMGELTTAQQQVIAALLKLAHHEPRPDTTGVAELDTSKGGQV